MDLHQSWQRLPGIYSCKKTLEARRYLGVVFSPLMYRYVLAGTQVCLLATIYLPEDAVTGNTDPHNLKAMSTFPKGFGIHGSFIYFCTRFTILPGT